MLGVNAASLMYVIRPDHKGHDVGELKYPYLKNIIDRHYLREYKQLDKIWLEMERESELLLDHEYLLMIAQKLQDTNSDIEKRLWSERYTEASVSIYGQPAANEVACMAWQELQLFKKAYQSYAACRPYLEKSIAVYSKLSSGAVLINSDLETRYTTLLKQLRKHALMQFDGAFNCFDGWNLPTMPIEEVKARFATALKVLACNDDTWASWDVTWIGGSTLMIDPRMRQIQIGRRLSELPTRRVKGLFAHEVLVHAQRSVNGIRLSPSLSIGLENQICAEEGLGVIMEAAINGQFPYRIKDRYIDIALALGMHNVQPMTRQELYDMAYGRALARRLAENVVVDTELLSDIIWTHVNRIYKGSLGNDFVGVFTRDIAYYVGFRQMANYILHRLDWGSTLPEVMDYLLLGKFDPTNPEHLLHLRQHVR